ncbi:MAG: ATP-dependent DNA ligase, partial [Actinomycetes bacterium]
LVAGADPDHPTHLVLDLDPPTGEQGAFQKAVHAARLVRQVLTDSGLDGAVKTSGAKGVHVFVPLDATVSVEEAAAATRAVAARAAALDPQAVTTAFLKEDRAGRVFGDAARVGGATVVAVYSPRVRPGVPVSFPVPWDDLDDVSPADFTIHSAPGLLAGRDPWSVLMPSPRRLPPDLFEQGRTIAPGRVQAMHEGRRRARTRRTQG